MRKFTVSLLCFCPMLIGQMISRLELATNLYNSGHYELSLKLLAGGQTDPEINNLIGKNYYMLGNFKKSSDFFKKAADVEPQKADYQLWAGRSFGRRAETSTPFRAPDYAKKAKQYFEKAVELDPGNGETLSDLFDYYLNAPKFLGGGLDKAESVIRRITKLNHAEGHYGRANLAEKKEEFELAEKHLEKAIHLAPEQAGYRIALAKFLARRGRFFDSEQAFSDAEKVSPNNPDLLFERADSYVHAKQNLDIAQELLKRYLEFDLTPNNPPRYLAEKLLKKISGYKPKLIKTKPLLL